ncbi:MAG: mercuric reductase [Planctomycetaceae bacterium]|nr:mercuric reductase [Planctomycetales bacterium]MCB9939934.1 mercuric reductase [Planctomycetaceae bacterium]
MTNEPRPIDLSPLSDIPATNPWDEHNQRWVDFVHPLDWKNPEPSGRYNLLVIGAGPAGLVTAIGAAGLGAKVALVEKHLMGGDCLNVGCVPSKALIAAGKAVAAVRDAHHFGVRVPEGTSIDFAAVMLRLRRIRADISHHDSAARFSELGIDVFIGDGEFMGRNTFAIDDKTIRFAKACIATGARAAAPPIDGLESVPYLTNETIFSLTELPRRIGFIGAGPIGCELSQAFRRFGSEVVLVESEHGILPREDREAADIVLQSLLRDGVDLQCCARNLRIRQEADGIHMAADSEHGKQHYDLAVDQLMVAVGRAPNVENLGLEAAGVEYHKKGIKVNDRLQTTNANIYAAGDVASKYQFTHSADFLARIVIGNALFFGRGRASALTIPWCTYTEPELAHVGKTVAELEADGIDFQTFTVQMSEIDRAILDGESDGFVRAHADRKGRLLGATVVAAHAGDMIGELSLAMTHGIPLGQIASAIHPYPTQAEAIRKLGDAFNRTRLTPTIKGLMNTVLKWRR